jgi:hypothetical protein
MTDPDPERYRHLPPSLRLEDTVTSQQVDVVIDAVPSEAAETAFMIRYCAG